jgi:hypothetical protein
MPRAFSAVDHQQTDEQAQGATTDGDQEFDKPP